MEYWYNTTFHDSTNTTPFRAVYGRDPPPLVRYGLSTTKVPAMETQLVERDLMLEELKAHLQRAQAKMKQRVDTHRLFQKETWFTSNSVLIRCIL